MRYDPALRFESAVAVVKMVEHPEGAGGESVKDLVRRLIRLFPAVERPVNGGMSYQWSAARRKTWKESHMQPPWTPKKRRKP